MLQCLGWERNTIFKPNLPEVKDCTKLRVLPLVTLIKLQVHLISSTLRKEESTVVIYLYQLFSEFPCAHEVWSNLRFSTVDAVW